jgi:hypothetical protein
MAGSKKAVRAALRESKKERLAQEDGTVTEQVIADDVESDEGACRAGDAVAVCYCWAFVWHAVIALDCIGELLRRRCGSFIAALVSSCWLVCLCLRA